MNKYHFFSCLYLRITWPVAQISATSLNFSIDQFSYAEENSQTTAFRRQNTQNVGWMKKKQLSACQTPRSIYPSMFNSFPVIRTASAKIAVFTYRSPHFCFPWGRPWGNHANVVWMEREFDAYKLPRCMCPSNYNRFCDRAIYWSKIVIFHTPLHSTPLLGGFPSEYRHLVRYEKN